MRTSSAILIGYVGCVHAEGQGCYVIAVKPALTPGRAIIIADFLQICQVLALSFYGEGIPLEDRCGIRLKHSNAIIASKIQMITRKHTPRFLGRYSSCIGVFTSHGHRAVLRDENEEFLINIVRIFIIALLHFFLLLHRSARIHTVSIHPSFPKKQVFSQDFFKAFP